MEKEKNELQDKTEQILSEVETLAKAEYEVARLKVIKYYTVLGKIRSGF